MLLTDNFKNPDYLIQPIFENRESVDSNYLEDVAKTKRFVERWIGDSDLRNFNQITSEDILNEYKIDIGQDVIDYFTQTRFKQEHQSHISPKLSLSIRRYSAFQQELYHYRNQIRSDCGKDLNLKFQIWRSQQIRRCFQEQESKIANMLVHAPVSFELSQGCSVGCWFCALSAPKLDDILLYNSENALLWKNVLHSVKEVIGAGAKYGFCYWATDPLDNPNYEKFCWDFYRVLGRFPTTTTALSLKDPLRTRNLLQLSRNSGCQINRFSILSLKKLAELHQTFTPQELLFVEVLPQNKETLVPKSLAGRSREYYQKHQDELNRFTDQISPLTSACVSGFLINMVERKVKLVSPCNSDDRWTLGYQIFQENSFDSAQDLQKIMVKMIDAELSKKSFQFI